jgi:hypothetical protein
MLRSVVYEQSLSGINVSHCLEIVMKRTCRNQLGVIKHSGQRRLRHRERRQGRDFRTLFAVHAKHGVDRIQFGARPFKSILGR